MATKNILFASSNIQLATKNIQLATMDIQLATKNVQFATKNIQLVTKDIQFQGRWGGSRSLYRWGSRSWTDRLLQSFWLNKSSILSCQPFSMKSLAESLHRERKREIFYDTFICHLDRNKCWNQDCSLFDHCMKIEEGPYNISLSFVKYQIAVE